MRVRIVLAMLCLLSILFVAAGGAGAMPAQTDRRGAAESPYLLIN